MTDVATLEACCACGARDLHPHLQVAGELGEDGLIPTTDQFGTALGDIARCGACGHMQLERMPADEVLESAYEDAESGDYVAEEAGQRATAREALDRIERWAPPAAEGRPRRILDLGCWVGYLLAEAQERGWEAVGVEPSRFAQAFAVERLGLDVRRDDLFTADLPLAAFDAVVLGDVIEHLPRPGEALERIAALLAPGGVLFMTLPDAGSRLARRMGPRWWSVLPTHVQYFTRTSMRTLLEREGYTPLWLGTAPKAFTVEYYLGRIGGYSKPAGDALVAGARTVRVADQLWAPDFRDRMGVLARRPS